MKKGMSALIGVVLLVALVVVVSGFIFNWIGSKTSEVSDEATIISEKLSACRDFNFKIEKAFCVPKEDGSDSGIVQVKVTNDGNVDVKEAFAARLIGPEDVTVRDKEADITEGVEATITSVKDIELEAYESRIVNIFKQTEPGLFGEEIPKPVESVEFVPRFFIGDEDVYCNDYKVSLHAENCGKV
ncbi:MAG: hypothetical protein CMH64_00750 [Nanoarchaeota archaeon]|nr:hypothetical protein [Nanoarchaeota archaeon]|tara:strand:+ start:765 stop:1322 length:558 start_codon:yes stop_codon:yes gene_type:complete